MGWKLLNYEILSVNAESLHQKRGQNSRYRVHNGLGYFDLPAAMDFESGNPWTVRQSFCAKLRSRVSCKLALVSMSNLIGYV